MICPDCNVAMKQLFFQNSLYCPNDCDKGGKKSSAVEGRHLVYIEKVLEPHWHGEPVCDPAKFVTEPKQYNPRLTSTDKWDEFYILNAEQYMDTGPNRGTTRFYGSELVVVKKDCNCDKCTKF